MHEQKKVLITGAGGFIGSHLIDKFINENYKVFAWGRSEGSRSGIAIESVDMLKLKEIENKLIEQSPNIIIHCAGAADVGKSVADPATDFQGNVEITHNLMFAIHNVKLPNIRVVFLSSAGVYGNPDVLPIDENAQLNPLSPYALHKVMCEDILIYFRRNYNTDVKIVRIFSAYGEGLKKQIFWDMHLKAKYTGRLAMFGTGNESRDYINIMDLVQGVYLVATKAPDNELIYNIANGEEITIRYATECFANAVGISKNSICFSGERKEGNPINWCADIRKLKALGYRQEVGFNYGIRKYVEWASEQND